MPTTCPAADAILDLLLGAQSLSILLANFDCLGEGPVSEMVSTPTVKTNGGASLTVEVATPHRRCTPRREGDSFAAHFNVLIFASVNHDNSGINWSHMVGFERIEDIKEGSANFGRSVLQAKRILIQAIPGGWNEDTVRTPLIGDGINVTWIVFEIHSAEAEMPAILRTKLLIHSRIAQ